MNRKKIFAVVVLSLVFSLLMTFAVSAETTTGWISNGDGTWSYMEDGELVRGEVGCYIEEADGSGAYYGFDANGIMYTGWVQPYKNNLWQNKEWREMWYFFEANGHAPDSGYNAETGYLFNYDGRVDANSYAHDYSTNIDRIFVSDESGRATELVGSEWQQVNGKWYYVNVNEWGGKQLYNYGVYNISGVNYCFYDGCMANYAFVHDYQNGVEVYADGDGHPIYAGWILDDGEYYYLQDGERLSYGIYTIGDKNYYFYDGGRMAENESIWVDDYESETSSYMYAGPGGALFYSNWCLNEDGNWEYYDGNGYRVDGQLYTVGESVYYFDYNGEMVTDEFRYIDEEGQYYYFADNGAGTLLNDWFKTEEGWKYYKNGVEYRDCIVEIEGVKYAFDYEGYLYDEDTWSYFYDGYYESAYSINANGTINTTPGWDMAGNSWVYITENGTLDYGWIFDGNAWYYMQPTMAKNTTIWDGDKAYYFRSNGTYIDVTADGFYKISAWDTYYFENGSIVTGWKQIGGNWYYLDASLYIDGSYWVDGDRYYFDQDGVMQHSGWFMVGDSWYLADASGRLYTGLQTLEETTYLFNEYGYLYDDAGIYYVGGVSYLMADGGSIIAKSTDAEGWKEYNGNWYYLMDGDFCRYGSYDIDGKYYSFDGNGLMIADEIYNSRYYKADGSRFTDGWFMLDGYWYYADENGWLSDDSDRIDGKFYYFRNYKLLIGTYTYDNEIVITDASGAVAHIQPFNEGWNLVTQFGHGTYYYIENGEFYTGWVGNYYVAGYNGMLCGGAEEIDGKCYYFYDDGTYAANTWIKNKYDSWYYAKADGELYFDEWAQIGSNWYYFDDYDMLEDCIYSIDGKDHKFAEGGAWLGEVAEVDYADGWHFIDGVWQYCQDGSFIGGIRKIDGVWYGFDYEGMVTNGFNNYGYYMNADGIVMEYTGWQIINGNWCYFNIENRVQSGWFTVAGTRYFGTSDWTEENGIEYGIATGYKAINGKLYNFASGGACLGEVTAEGWYYVDEEWYYVRNGELITNEIAYINGVCYAFDYEGEMYTYTTYYDDDANRWLFFGGDGAKVTAQGWYLLDGEWLYVDADGYLLTGTHIIDGASYYFDFGYNYYY